MIKIFLEVESVDCSITLVEYAESRAVANDIIDVMYEHAAMFYVSLIQESIDSTFCAASNEDSARNERAMLANFFIMSSKFFCQCVETLFSETCSTRMYIDDNVSNKRFKNDDIIDDIAYVDLRDSARDQAVVALTEELRSNARESFDSEDVERDAYVMFIESLDSLAVNESKTFSEDETYSVTYTRLS